MIKINRIKPQSTIMYSSEGIMGKVNDQEFKDLCIQVKNKSEFMGTVSPVPSGYYTFFDETRIDILLNGKLSNYPVGFFDDVVVSIRFF